MVYRDMREWLADMELAGEVKHIHGADRDLEMSGLTIMIYREGKRPVPALLFDDIPGFPRGYRTLFGLLSSPRRLATALYLPVPEGTVHPVSVVENWRKKEPGLKPVPPVLVDSGPVLANRFVGDSINLERFPSPKCNELDGGRYIGTAHAVITRDPDTGWINLGTYRCMLVDRNRMALHMLEGAHGRIIFEKHRSRKQVMPVAVAIGIDPTLYFASGQRVPWGLSEYDYAGGIRNQPIEVIRGEHTGLPLPATAEILIEGECRPDDLVDEGPFGEWHGYYANQGLEPVPEPAIRVKAVYHRDNPILVSSAPSIPPGVNSLVGAVGRASLVWTALEKVGLPGIKRVWAPEEGPGLLLTIVSITQMYAGHSRDVGLIASQCVGGMGRYTVVVDDDIDPSDLNQVVWAITTRTDPQKSIQVLEHCGSSSADPAIPASVKREHRPLHGSRAVIDACRPYEHRSEWYPIASASPDLVRRLRAKWQSLLDEMR